jgi:REP element-mobilizing transposase RayT
VHTYTSIYLHVIFATWSRHPFLTDTLRPRVHAYLATTARNLGVADVHVGGHEDHVHLLGRFDPANAPSALIGQIKQAATYWLHEENVREFRWQRGFSAFSVSRDRVPVVIRYIQRQEDHHRKRTFREELEWLLHAHGARLEDGHLL